MADARQGGVLLAYAMNGEPLPLQHGYPLRVIVPDWYAVASVKWLTEIELVDRPFSGHYQTDKYRYEWQREGQIVREPVTLQRVRALITEPSPHQELPARRVCRSRRRVVGRRTDCARGSQRQRRNAGRMRASSANASVTAGSGGSCSPACTSPAR